MDILYRIFGPPHELLHVIALWIIGRRPRAVSIRHVDIPDDLSTREYVFVAGLPALVFWGAGLWSLMGVVNAGTFGEGVVCFLLFMVCSMAGFGTLGDLQLIAARLKEERRVK